MALHAMAAQKAVDRHAELEAMGEIALWINEGDCGDAIAMKSPLRGSPFAER